MNTNDFINTVAEMREAQRQYFRTRMPHFLMESKKLEKEVDKAIEAHYEARRNPELFEKDGKHI